RLHFIPRHPHPPSPLFPYTTLFRSVGRRHFHRRLLELRRRRRGRLFLQFFLFHDVGLDRRRDHFHHAAREPRRERPREEQVHARSEEHTSELQSLRHLVCRLLLEKK